MKINEVFPAIQGEGHYSGNPVLFIRLSGCTRACDFCDTKYHTEHKDMTSSQLVDIITVMEYPIVVWTGGEPLLQRQEIYDVISKTLHKQHHLETNGDLIEVRDWAWFKYLSISPKDLATSQRVKELAKDMPNHYDIKVVTDMHRNRELIPYATMLMPLETGEAIQDEVNRKAVWNACIHRKLKFSPRLQTLVWGYNRKGI